MLIPYCGDLPGHFDDRASLHHLPAATSFTLPLYTRIQLHVPSLIDTLSWVWRERISHIELSTPGPMGLVGLLIAKVLRLPVTASYHTEVPALIQPLGGNAFMERAARRYLAWFYAHVDRVFAFSSGSRDALVDMGVSASKLSVMPVAIDPEDFSPVHCGAAVFDDLNLDVGDRPVILSVGRISEEKNIPIIVEAVERLQGRSPRPLLVIAGDGPERADARAHVSRQGVRALRRPAARRHAEEALRVGAHVRVREPGRHAGPGQHGGDVERRAGAGAVGRLHRRVRHRRPVGGVLRVRAGRAVEGDRAHPGRSVPRRSC